MPLHLTVPASFDGEDEVSFGGTATIMYQFDPTVGAIRGLASFTISTNVEELISRGLLDGASPEASIAVTFLGGFDPTGSSQEVTSFLAFTHENYTTERGSGASSTEPSAESNGGSYAINTEDVDDDWVLIHCVQIEDDGATQPSQSLPIGMKIPDGLTQEQVVAAQQAAYHQYHAAAAQRNGRPDAQAAAAPAAAQPQIIPSASSDSSNYMSAGDTSLSGFTYTTAAQAGDQSNLKTPR